MPKTGQRNKSRRNNSVIEARAGLIPASDDMVNEIRVRTNLTARMIRTVKPYLGSVARVSDDLAITSILSDLRHYCDRRNLAFRNLDAAARALYLEEKDHEKTWSIPAEILKT